MRAVVLLAVVSPLILTGGCAGSSSSNPDTASTTVERGPLRFTVEITPQELLVGDPLTLVQRVETPDGYTVVFHDNDALGDLHVQRVETQDARPGVEGGLVWHQTLYLIPLASGRVEIPALVVRYTRPPEGATSQPAYERELESKPLYVEVRSALAAADSVANPRDITGTLLAPRDPLTAKQWAMLIGAAVAVAVLVVIVARAIYRRVTLPAPPIAPEVWARRALDALWASGLIQGGSFKEFYYRVSEIVRGYIERKFGLAAPEMTTEEFLRALSANRSALPCDADSLRTFLEACDLVKYAALAAQADDAERALQTARVFVETTSARALSESQEARSGSQAA